MIRKNIKLILLFFLNLGRIYFLITSQMRLHDPEPVSDIQFISDLE